MSSDAPPTPPPPEPPPAPPPGPQPAAPVRGTGRLVGGVILVVIAVLALAIGGTLLGLYLGTRDGDGFFEIDENRLATPTRALVSDSVEVDLGDAWFVDNGDLGDLRLAAESRGGGPVFVGIGPTADVRRYLAGVAQQQADFDDGDRGDSTLGARAPARPGSQAFWAASAEGPGRQAAVWPISDGEWSGVVMNADGSPGVDVTAQLGFKTDLGLWVGVIALVVGLIMLSIGVVMLVSRARARARSRQATGPPPAPPAAPPPAPDV
ncbi:MAG TPA: hypothetical protein PKD59_05325 [Miltoncostaeaceae bacterium]|nr:hypothetical protein [Miltoncostaeaceae bacterium]